MAHAIADRGIGCLTFNFLYTERRRRIPDRNDSVGALLSQGDRGVP